MKLHSRKYKFYYDIVEYLDHIFYARGLGMIGSEMVVIVSLQRPLDIRWLSIFLGLANYYIKLVKKL